MSNYIVVKPHPLGGFAVVIRAYSEYLTHSGDDVYPDAKESDPQFLTIAEAIGYALLQNPEYGVRLDT